MTRHRPYGKSPTLCPGARGQRQNRPITASALIIGMTIVAGAAAFLALVISELIAVA